MSAKKSKTAGKGSGSIIGVLLVALILVAGGISLKNHFFPDAPTPVKLGFENIGELATQSAYVKELGVIDEPRRFFFFDVPFTQSKYIFSCDFVIKAGFNFEEIEWQEDGSKITVKMPKVQVLSVERLDDSLEVYHEAESKFRQVKLEETFATLDNMKQDARNTAIKNGLLDNAKVNAETILIGFFGNEYNMDEYKIEFIYNK